jgi:hypothetical protein
LKHWAAKAIEMATAIALIATATTSFEEYRATQRMTSISSIAATIATVLEDS